MSQSAGFIYNYNDRIGSRILSFGISGNPSSEANFAGLEYFDFRLNQVSDPTIGLYHAVTSLFDCISARCPKHEYKSSLQNLQNTKQLKRKKTYCWSVYFTTNQKYLTYFFCTSL